MQAVPLFKGLGKMELVGVAAPAGNVPNGVASHTHLLCGLGQTQADDKLTKYIVEGGRPLFGEIPISGAKNAAVAIIPAALMVSGPCRIENMRPRRGSPLSAGQWAGYCQNRSRRAGIRPPGRTGPAERSGGSASCGAAATPSSPTRSRRAPIWPPWRPAAGEGRGGTSTSA